MKKALSNILCFILILAAVFWGSYFGSDIIENYIEEKKTEKLKADALATYDGCIGFSSADKYDDEALRAVKTSVIENYTHRITQSATPGYCIQSLIPTRKDLFTAPMNTRGTIHIIIFSLTKTFSGTILIL